MTRIGNPAADQQAQFASVQCTQTQREPQTPMNQTPARLFCLLAIPATFGSACSSDETSSDNAPTSAETITSAGETGIFVVDGTDATMSGEIGSSTPDDVRQLIANNPDVTTIVMADVPGSGDDEANLEASRLIREAGLNTHLNANGFVASGGVDFYLAGTERTFDEGAEFGVHSWATSDGVEGKDLDMDDPEHSLYLGYYDEIGISADFYWFTLEAAPAADIHIMTNAELDAYGFATN